MADDNPFADLIPEQGQSPAASNPFADLIPAEKPGPLHQFGEIGRDISKDASAGLDTMGRGVQGIMHPDPTIHERLGALADIPLGAAEYLGAPISGAAKAVVGDPSRSAARYAGLPEGAQNFVGNMGEQVAGLVGPGMFGKVAREAAPVVSKLVSKRPEMAQRAADFETAGITPSLPALAQDRGVSTTAKVIGDVPLVGAPVSERIQQNIGEAAKSTENIASQFSSEGAGLPEEGGEALQKGRAQFLYGQTGKPNPPALETASDIAKPTRQVGFIPKSEALYDRIPIGAGSNAQVNNTVDMLHNLRTQFPSNPELNALLSNPAFDRMFQAIKPGFEEVAGAPSIRGTTALHLEPNAGDFLAWQKHGFSVEPTTTLSPTGGLSWDDLKNLRSYAGRKMRDPSDQLGLGPDAWKALYGAASRDMEATAIQNGPDALKAFNQATNYYKAGLQRLNDAMGFIEKADSPEQAYYGLTKMGMAQGKSANIDRLATVMKSMPDEFRDDVSATVIRRLGLPKPGAAGQAAEPFSIGTWGTNYASISDKAKDVLFGPGGTERRDSLDALSRALTSLKNVERLGNAAGSGRYANLALAAGSFGAGITTHPLATIGSTVAATGAAHLLMNPTIARWIANATKVTTEGGWAAQMARLNSLAEKYPETVGPYAAAVTAAQESDRTPDQPP